MIEDLAAWIRRIRSELRDVRPDADAEPTPFMRAQSGEADAARDWESEGGSIESDDNSHQTEAKHDSAS